MGPHLHNKCCTTEKPKESCGLFGIYGIDFPTKEELVSSSRSTNDIKELLGVGTLGYISLEGLLSPFENPKNFCTACFTGKYPVEIKENLNKKALENH